MLQRCTMKIKKNNLTISLLFCFIFSAITIECSLKTQKKIEQKGPMYRTACTRTEEEQIRSYYEEKQTDINENLNRLYIARNNLIKDLPTLYSTLFASSNTQEIENIKAKIKLINNKAAEKGYFIRRLRDEYCSNITEFDKRLAIIARKIYKK